MLPYLAMVSFSQPLTRRRDASARLVLLIVSAGFALATLDLFVVNVALPDIAQDVGSALCATADSTLALVIFRIVQAAGAALMTPTSLSMVLATSSDQERDNNV